MGLTDGFGGNNWRLVTTASARDEIAKCSSVTELLYADGQGDTTKAISDINAMVAKGVKALVVFPDAGQAILPALRDAYNAGVVTVPYRVDPSGVDGTDFDIWIGGDFVTDGKNWGEWTKANFPNGANILFLSGPAGNSQGVDERKGFESVLGDGTGAYKYIGEQPFEVTNWDAALTQKVLTAAIAKYSKIDVIMSDFGPVMVSSLGEFTKSGRSIPALATSDGNILGCFFQDNVKANKDFKLCKTYPQYMVMPRGISDEELFLVSNFRSGHRLPTLSWGDKENGATLWRSSQPKAGVSGSCLQDEKFLELLAQSCVIKKDPLGNRKIVGEPILHVVDCRPRASAMANRATGAGYESQTNYPYVRLEFYNIGNIHVMRDSLKGVMNLVLGPSPPSGDIHFSRLVEDSQWLQHLRYILKASWDSASFLRKGMPVLVHCSHGWCVFLSLLLHRSL
jgi:hypothetical protein